MNKRGFTLIELLAVITILAVLGVIIVPIIKNVISKNKRILYDTQIRNIEGATSNYVSENIFSINIPNGSSVGIHLSFLKNNGYIDKDIANPITNEKFNDNMIIIITNNNNSYSYTVCDEGVSCNTNVNFLDSE